MYKGFLLVGVLSVLVIAACKKLPDTSDEHFIRDCQQHCLSQGKQFNVEESLKTEPNTCVCSMVNDRTV